MSAILATAEATKNYADRMWAENPRISPDSWRIMEGLTVAKVATGTYRMDGREAQPQALEKALTSGLNLIDTSANYMDGGAEVFIGQTLAKLFAAGALAREEVVVVSKAGYMQGKTLEQWRQNPPPEAVKCAEHMWHCVHPDFLHQQFEASLKRLGLDGLDVYLLHNPEYFLADEASKDTAVEDAQEEFYARLQKAFTYLETLCQQGRLGCYGVSSNTFVSPSDAPDFVDLARVFQAAQTAAKEAWGRRKRPMLRVVQMPYNLLETAAVTRANTQAKTFEGGEQVSALELATRMRLGVLINRPLNAFSHEGRPYRLAEGAKEPDMASLIKELEAAEAALPENDDLPRLSRMAEGLAAQMENSLHFDHLKTTALTPLLIQTLTQADISQTEKKEFIQAYGAVVAALRQTARAKDAQANQKLKEAIYKRLPESARQAPFQQVAINTIASTPGVTSVLCGLRQPGYVNDALKVLEEGDIADIGQIMAA